MSTPSVKEYESTILSYSKVCYKKIKKPTYLTLEDIIQEGNTVFTICLNTYSEYKHKVFFTYFIRCLKNRFGAITHNSYKSVVNAYSEDTFESPNESIKDTQQIAPISLCNCINNKILKEIDIEFIRMLLEPPENIIEDLKNFPEKAHNIIAKALGMSPYQRRKSVSRIHLAIIK